MDRIIFKEKDNIIKMLKDEGVYKEYEKLTDSGKTAFVDFCTGHSLRALTYDSIFKTIFNPEYHKDRLEHFLSAILGFEVKVLRVLPVESTKMLETGSILIMDILVQTANGSIINVEMQRCPYKFTGKRDSCYLADMIMRQYNGLKAQIKSEGGHFSYEDMKPVYSLIFLENSYGDLLNYSNVWEHCGKMEFDTGLKMNFLENIRYLQLDNFRKIVDNNIKTEKEMWMALLSANTPEKVARIAGMSEEMFEIVSDVATFVTDVRMVMDMFSEALRMLDRNTEKLMMDEAMEKVKKLQKLAEEEKQKVEEAKQRVEEEKQRAEEEKQRADVEKQKADVAELEKEILRCYYKKAQNPEDIAKELKQSLDYVKKVLEE